MISLQAELHKTQVVVEAALGQGSVKILRDMQTDKKQKFFTHMFVSFQQQC